MKKVLSAIIVLAMCASLITAIQVSVSAETNILISYDFSDGIGDWTAGEVVDGALKISTEDVSNLELGTYQTGVYRSSVDFVMRDVTGTSSTGFKLGWTASGDLDTSPRAGYFIRRSNSGFILNDCAEWSYSSDISYDYEYTLTGLIDLNTDTYTVSVTKKGDSTVIDTATGAYTGDLKYFTVEEGKNDGYILLDNFVFEEVITEEQIEGTVVTGGETYIQFPAKTVVTEGVWNGSFDFMTDVADGSNVKWRNTFMNGINGQGGTKIIGAWVYTEGTSGLHVKAGDWDGSYQGALTKGTWYTCKVTIDYDDTTSGYNARWYIYERETGIKKAEYWWNATTSIDRLLMQDENKSGKCYVDNVEVSVVKKPVIEASYTFTDDFDTTLDYSTKSDKNDWDFTWSSGPVEYKGDYVQVIGADGWTQLEYYGKKTRTGRFIGQVDICFDEGYGDAAIPTESCNLADIKFGSGNNSNARGVLFKYNAEKDAITALCQPEWTENFYEDLQFGTWYTIRVVARLDADTAVVEIIDRDSGEIIVSHDTKFFDDVSYAYMQGLKNRLTMIDNFVFSCDIDPEYLSNYDLWLSSHTMTMLDKDGNVLDTLNGAYTINSTLKFNVGRQLSKDARIFAAIYSNDNKLIDIAQADVVLTENSNETTVKVQLDEAYVESNICKLFVWENGSNLKPLTTPLDLKKTIQPIAIENGVSMHNSYMKLYLDDTYDSIENYANGIWNEDFLEPITFKWNYIDKGECTFVLEYGEKSDMSDAKRVETTKNFHEAYNLKIGTTYYWRVTVEYEDGTTYTSDISSFTTVDKAPRVMFAQNLKNFRDLGGWKTVDGKRVKQGLVYRSYCPDYIGDDGEHVVYISDLGIDTMVNEIGIKTEIDIRGDNAKTSSVLGDDVSYYKYVINHSSDFISTSHNGLKQIFKLLADESNYPLFYHCQIGTDRTGAVSYLLNGLLGVAKEDLLRDYLLSNFSTVDLRTVSTIADLYVKTLDNYDGDTLQEKIYNYLNIEVGVSKEDLDFIIDYLTE